MSNSSGNSLLYTLRGKIWISTSVLAFFICTFGLISYLVVTLLTSNPFYGVFIPFIFLAFSVIVFGWWLSNEMVNPIDKVILLSKSLERNSSTTLPKTSGSAETDQLLFTLHRNSKQIQNVMTLMDKVANGNVDVALTPLKGSDKLTASFQKLLTKVSESIHAKDELNKLEYEIAKVKSDLASVRSGNLSVEIESDHYQTKEIADTLNYLLENLTLMISLIKVDSHLAEESATEVKDKLETIVKQDEQRMQEMNQASITLKQVPNFIEKLTDNLTQSANSAKHTIEKTRRGSQISQDNSESVSQLRSNLRESINRIQGLNERSQEIAKVAKIVEDLANRTNMIALNASIQATEFGDDGHGFVLVSEELERLAARADGTNKQISMLNNSILSEIGRVEDSLENTLGGVAGLSKQSIESGNILSELERYIGQFLNLQDNLIAVSKDQSEVTDDAFETVEGFIEDAKNKIEEMTVSANEIRKISLMMKNLQSHSVDFRVTPEVDADEAELHNSLNPDDETSKDLTPKETVVEEFSTDEFNKVKLSTQEFEAMKDVPNDVENSESNEDENKVTFEDLSNFKIEENEPFEGFSTVEPESPLPDLDDSPLELEDNQSIEHLSTVEDNENGSIETLSTVGDENFDSEEFNIKNTKSSEFDPEELFSESFRPFEESEKQKKSEESVSESSYNDAILSEEFNSEEFLTDDLDIDMDKLDSDELQSDVIDADNLNSLEEELLNLNPDANPDQNTELPA